MATTSIALPKTKGGSFLLEPRTPDEIYSPEDFTEEHLAIARTADEFWQKERLAGRKVLGLHIGSGGTKNLPLKRWPLKHYAGLVRQLNKERPDIHVLLFGGPEEAKDHQVVLAQADRNLTQEAKTKNLRETAALMKHCSAFLSVDTALMHLAAALKVLQESE